MSKERRWICPKCKNVVLKAKGNTTAEQMVQFMTCRECGLKPVEEKDGK